MQAIRIVQGTRKPTKKPGGTAAFSQNQNLHGLYEHVEALRDLGHSVTITTLDGAEMQKRMIAIAKNRHKCLAKYLIKRGKVLKRGVSPFDPADVVKTEACKSLSLDVECLHSIMWSPPTAVHFHKTCPKVSESDFAQIFGGTKGVVYTHRWSDSIRHKQTLVTGIVLDNETTAAHNQGNNAAIEHIERCNDAGGEQSDILDGDKGGDRIDS